MLYRDDSVTIKVVNSPKTSRRPRGMCRLQYIDSQMVRRDWVTNTHTQEESEKMLITDDYQRNSSQKHNEVPPHTSQNGHHQQSMNSKCWRGCGEKGTRLHHWQECKNVNWYSHDGEHYGIPSKKIKTKLSYDSAISLLGINLEKKWNLFKNIQAPQCSQQHYLQ